MKESETEEPVRRLATSNGIWDIMREERKRYRGACEEAGDKQRKQTREITKRKMTLSGEGLGERRAI